MLEIATVRTDADLEDMIRVQALVRPDWRPKLENLRHNLESNPDLSYFVGRVGEEPVACGFVEPWADFSQGDLAVVPARRRRGIGSALFAEISVRARGFGKTEIQGEVQESDAESRAFFERRGFVQTGGEKAVVLELDGIEPSEVEPPKGVRIVSRAEEPDRLDEMYALAVQADEDIPGSAGRQSYERWRAMLKRAEIAAAKRAGFKRLLTESEERNEPMRRLNEKLGFVPAPEWSTVVMRGPLA